MLRFHQPRGFSVLGLVLGLAIVAGLAAFPLLVDDPYAHSVLILLFLAIITGAAWNIVGGYAGQYSVGHAAYFGVGAYVTMILLSQKQIPPWYGVFVAMAIAVAVALVVGTITFRLRGPYFVLASIAVAEIFRLIALNWKSATNGAEGILLLAIPPLEIGGKVVFDIMALDPARQKIPFYFAGLALAVVVIGVNWAVQHSKLGYYFQAIREDQDAAHSLGIHLAFWKNVALVLSAIFTAWAGSYYALYTGFIDPNNTLTTEISVQMVLICIIGGIGTILGPVVGSLVVVPLSEALRATLGPAHALIYGILVVLVILFMPDGILGFVRKLATRGVAEKPAAPSARPQLEGKP
jgi:branched-chain amino acid transport system permease protein